MRSPSARGGLLIAVGGLLLGWSLLPWWLPPLLALGRSGDHALQVVSVAAGDFRRTQSAVALWRGRPGGLLALTVPEGMSQAMNLQVLRGAALAPEETARLRWISTCGDTVTELADLTRWLAGLPGPGSLTVVTSPEHLPRTLAIARVMAGGRGWQVRGVASLTSEHKPETVLRLWRDRLRAQLWRATGWTGRHLLVCPMRTRGLPKAAAGGGPPQRLHSPFAHLLVRPQ